MPDVHVSEQRHKNMAAIRAKDTKPEIMVRKYLWSHGFRYRLNHPRLPGKPDIVLRKYRTCIFVNGCFWHGHNLTWLEGNDDVSMVKGADYRMLVSSECCKIPNTNRDFWVKKMLRNRERDLEVRKKLAAMGWNCITIWECELMGRQTHLPGEKTLCERTLESLAYTLSQILLQKHRPRKYDLTDAVPMMMAADEN